MALWRSIRRRVMCTGGFGGAYLKVLTAIHRACADGVSGLKWQSFCCCSEYSHPSPPFFSSGSWVLRFLFGMGRSLAKSRRRLGMNRRDFFS